MTVPVSSAAPGIRSRGQAALEVFARLVQPSLVAIYTPPAKRPNLLKQTGSGFLVAHGAKPVLVTAAHVLYGHRGDEDPADKAFQIGPTTVFVGDKPRNIIKAGQKDLCVVNIEEFSLDRCLRSDQIASAPIQPEFVTLGGFLARDFKRDGATLRPAPQTYTNRSLTGTADGVELKYPKRRNVNSNTGAAAVAPQPSGLSGGAMVDTVALSVDKVLVVGVFTEQADGKAFGEWAALIHRCMAAV